MSEAITKLELKCITVHYLKNLSQLLSVKFVFVRVPEK
ncbi:hypothetical protein D1BOALGB6SA_3294 [Olavius sp. associated proteobacterium Delta 1]|nr:hypothetical protein D1BOALGB6SA_3294 [Olavius sp. associated proteobacterium Delta 1]